VVPRVLVQELKQEVAEGQEHQRDGEHMGHGVLAQSVVVWELKQEREVVPMLIQSAVLHVLDHVLKDDLAEELEICVQVYGKRTERGAFAPR